ncbi:MAG: diguanylate cyclase [Gemmatimonadaceae bacterium]
MLLYGDLDDFKQVNDVYGHAVGDSALRDAGGILRETLRETDVIGRIGVTSLQSSPSTRRLPKRSCWSHASQQH